MADIAAIKTKSRRSIHDALAVSAIYEDDETPPNDKVTVRWHNRLVRNGSLDEGSYDVAIIEGIDRLVFNETNLAAAGITLKRNGVLTVPSLGAKFELEAMAEPDGPENVYWMVTRVKP